MNIFNDNIKDRVLPDKTFGFDIDDVVGDLMNLIVDALNEMWEKNHTIDDVKDWEFGWILKGNSPTYLKDLIVAKWMYEKMPIFEETKNFINSIKDTHQIMFITSRFNYPGIDQITKKWFEDSGIYYDSIHFERFKSYFCKTSGVDYFVDDSLENAIKISKNSKIQVYLLDKPWNRQQEMDRLVKEGILTMDQINEEMKKIKRINSVWELNSIFLKQEVKSPKWVNWNLSKGLGL